jgi:hypothetical protein
MQIYCKDIKFHVKPQVNIFECKIKFVTMIFASCVIHHLVYIYNNERNDALHFT